MDGGTVTPAFADSPHNAEHHVMRNLVALLCLVSSLWAFAAGGEKQYRKYIENYDVADQAKGLDSINPAVFWRTAIDNNGLFAKFVKDMEKNRGAEKEALRRTAELPKFYPEYDESIVENLQGYCDSLLTDMGIRDLGMDCSLHIVYSDDPNAFTIHTEDGFAICVTTGLYFKKGVSREVLTGYVAHEFAHGALRHHTQQFYRQGKERRKNEVLGGIAFGLGIVGVIVRDCCTPRSADDCPGREVVYIDNSDNNIGDDAKISTLNYTFRYARGQEVEADLFAYRFMQHMGWGDEFLNGLRILGTEYDCLYGESRDHPTTSFRIEMLKYALAHPELGNRQNGKLLK